MLKTKVSFKSIGCYVFKNPLGDCTKNGISSKNTHLYLIYDHNNYIDEIELILFMTENNVKEVLILEERKTYNGIYKSCRPYKLNDSKFNKSWFMAGGNFIYTSDSRFPSNQPISIHDRVE